MQGDLTSAALAGLIHARLTSEGLSFEKSADKTTLLQRLQEARGLQAVFEVGHALRELPSNPVLQALCSGPTAPAVLERWIRLERFGHTRNRTKLLRHTDTQAVLEHFARDGGAIHPVNDLFLWGLLVALLEQAGFSSVRARLDRPETMLYSDGRPAPVTQKPQETLRLILDWGPRQRTTAPPEPLKGQIHLSLRALFQSDLLRTWRLDAAARALRTSKRQLQRALSGEGTTFSEALQKTRTDAASALIQQTRLSLTEIAYCTGFSDSAHLARIFRRLNDLPPSALRRLPAAPEGS